MYLSKGVQISFASLMGVFLLIALPSLADIAPENIVGMWLFNEGDGSVATDSSKQGNDGTIHGATWVDGKFGNALEFDGVDNWVEVPHSDTVGFAAGTSFTITLHFKGTAVGGSLAGKNYEDTSQALPWYLLWNGGADNKITFFLRDNASASFRAESTSDIADDSWHFIAGRADAETGKATLWVDGVQESEVDFNTDDEYGTSEGPFHIGRHFDRYTTGIIDEVILFNVALDEADIEILMNDGVEAVTAVEPVDKLTTTWGRIKQQIGK